jgi:hypothetical protein
MSGAVRSAQPTTPATRPGPWASASSSGVSQGSATVCTTTVAVTPLAAASGARSAGAKFRSSGASPGSLRSQGWSCADTSQKCWWASMTGGAPGVVTGQLTSLSLPVATSKTKPRMASVYGTNGLAWIRAID